MCVKFSFQIRRPFKCCNRPLGKTIWAILIVIRGTSTLNQEIHSPKTIPNLNAFHITGLQSHRESTCCDSWKWFPAVWEVSNEVGICKSLGYVILKAKLMMYHIAAIFVPCMLTDELNSKELINYSMILIWPPQIVFFGSQCWNAIWKVIDFRW